MKSINNPSGNPCTTAGVACNTYNALGQRVVAYLAGERDRLALPSRRLGDRRFHARAVERLGEQLLQPERGDRSPSTLP